MRKSLGGKGESPFLRVRVPRELLDALRKLAQVADEGNVSLYVRRILAEHFAGKKMKGGR